MKFFVATVVALLGLSAFTLIVDENETATTEPITGQQNINGENERDTYLREKQEDLARWEDHLKRLNREKNAEIEGATRRAIEIKIGKLEVILKKGHKELRELRNTLAKRWSKQKTKFESVLTQLHEVNSESAE